MRQNPTHPSRQGFTLVELMIVVAVIAVLAAIAIPSTHGVLMTSRASEATTFLGEIDLRQESYKSEYGQYCDVGGTTTNLATAVLTPLTTPTTQQLAWTTNSSWDQLGADPGGPVWFQYTTAAGAPGSTPTPALGFNGTDYWFVAWGISDLDGDTTKLTFERYAGADYTYCSSSAGWE